jgi:hypothetical protein
MLISVADSSNSESLVREKGGLAVMERSSRTGEQACAVFLFGFAKSERENIEPDELAELRQIGLNWLNASTETLSKALDEDSLEEIVP